MKESVEIRDKEIARILTDVTQVSLLEPFFKDDITLSDAAKELDVKLTTLLYHVTKFMRLGLIEITREEARKGKAVKYYRTTAKVFFVPFDITPSLSLKHLLAHLARPSDEVFIREITRTLQDLSSQWGIDISLDPSGQDDLRIAIRRRDRPRIQDISFNPDEPALMSSTNSLHLDFATAKDLQKDLRALFESYHKKQNPKEQLYLYRIGLTPVQDESLEPKD
jgi:hypothetical protein